MKNRLALAALTIVVLLSSGIVANAGGGGNLIPNVELQKAKPGEQFKLVVSISNPLSRPAAFDAKIWHGGQGWKGEDYPYSFSSGTDVYWLECYAWSGCTHYWTGVIPAGGQVFFTLPTFASNTIGTFRFVDVMLATSQGMVQATGDLVVGEQPTIVSGTVIVPTNEPTKVATNIAGTISPPVATNTPTATVTSTPIPATQTSTSTPALPRNQLRADIVPSTVVLGGKTQLVLGWTAETGGKADYRITVPAGVKIYWEECEIAQGCVIEGTMLMGPNSVSGQYLRD